MSGGVVFSVAEADGPATARRLAQVPPGCSWVEIRADRLRVAELPALLAASPCPVLVAARRREEGGAFDRSEAERGALLSAALAGGASIDVEWGSALARLAEGPQAERVVLSHHGGPCRLPEMLSIYREMAVSRASRLKLVPRAERPSQGRAVRDLLAQARQDGRALASFAMGEAGTATRVLALAWGSWATYGSAEEEESATAEGQIPARVLLDVFGARALGQGTRRFGLAGRPLGRSKSPALHHAGYRATGLDACYLPFPTDDPAEVEALVAAFDLEGFGVTIPLKEAVAGRCTAADAVVAGSGAVNTVVVRGRHWTGHNTDGAAAGALVSRFLDPAGRRVLVLGAGGTAAGIGAALAAAGARVALGGRTAARVERLAARLGAEVVPWSQRHRVPWDVLVQATPLGGEGEEVLPPSALSGEVVLDAAYGKAETPLVAAARARGLAVADGLDLLVAQGARQFALLAGRNAPMEVLEAAVRVPQQRGGAA